MTADPWNTTWGPKPYPAVTFAHACFWFMAIVSVAAIGLVVLWCALAFEALGLTLYSRWLLGLRPYEKGAHADTMRSA